MRAWKKALVGSVAAAGVMLGGTAGAVAAEPGLPPGLPEDVFTYSDHWIDFPSHVVCEPGEENHAELIIALSENWSGGSSFEVVNGTGDQDYSTEDYLGTWPQVPEEILLGAGFVDVAAGEWTIYPVPIDERGAQVWLRDLIPTDGEEEGAPVGGGFSHSLVTEGGGAAFCQAAPEAPRQDGAVVLLPEIDGITYHVAPREIDGSAVSGFVDVGYFVGFIDEATGDLVGEPLSGGSVGIPASGLQVAATAGGYVFDFGHLNPVQWRWEFDATAVVVTPEAPSQDGNIVTIPDQAGVRYQDGRGAALDPGRITLHADLTVIAFPEDGYEFTDGSATEWVFAYVPPSGAGGDQDEPGDEPGEQPIAAGDDDANDQVPGTIAGDVAGPSGEELAATGVGHVAWPLAAAAALIALGMALTRRSATTRS